jgi:hypothetical protein
MAHTWPRLERRLSRIRDRRLVFRGGRRATDGVPLSRPNPDKLCSLCRVGLAVVTTVSYEEGQRVTTYRCPVCGHIQYVSAPT